MYGSSLNSHLRYRLCRTAPQDGGTGGGGGGNGGNQGQGGNQNQGGGNGPGLLDSLASEGGEGGDDDPPGAGGGTLTLEQVTQAIQTSVPQIVESAIDRRINGMNNRGGGRRRRQQPQSGQQQNQDGGEQNQPAPVDEEPGPDEGARREARLSAKLYLGDEIRFVDSAERAVADRLVAAACADWDTDGNADLFGRDVARQVTGEIRTLRNRYETLLLKQLRKRGMLVDQGQGGQQPAPGFGSAGPTFPTTQKDPAAQAVAGAKSAAQQWNERNGHVVQTQQTAGTS